MIELKYNFLQWFKRHHFLYIFVFLVNFNPINSFFYEMLATTKDISVIEKYKEDIYPSSAYTSVIMSFVIFLLLGFCDFKLVLLAAGIGGLVPPIIYFQGYTVVDMQIAEGFCGCAIATEIIYYASIYVCHDNKKNFGRLSAYIRAPSLTAKMVSAILAQILVTNGWLNYLGLAFISVPAVGHAIFLLQHLPAMYDLKEPPDTFLLKISWFKDKFKETISIPHVLKWALWTAFTVCGYIRVSALMQPFWREAQQDNQEPPYNGAIEGVAAFLSLLAVLLSGTFTPNLKHENVFLCAASALQGALLFAFVSVDSSWDSTIIYIVFNIVYHFVMTSVSAMIAENVFRKGCFGMVFGFINLICFILNLIFVCVINKVVTVTIQGQLMIFGIYHLILTAVMLLLGLVKVL